MTILRFDSPSKISIFAQLNYKKLKMKNYPKIILLGALVALVGCQQSEKLTISGSVSGAEGDTLTIKHLVNNVLTEVESKVLSQSGSFKFSLQKQKYPEYYFLQINDGSQLVLIRDSSDVIKVNGNGSSLKEASIEGSNVSIQIQEMMKRVAMLRKDYLSLMKEIDTLDADVQQERSDKFIAEYDALKDYIGAEIISDPKSYYSYYALYQRIEQDHMLFSPYDEKDYKYYAMVATSYDMYHKNDPRTIALYEMVEGVLAERRKAKLQQLVDEAPGGLPDIIMNDVNGNEQKLSDLNGKIVVLNFWSSRNPDSRGLNQELLVLYEKYKRKGLSIYQVSADKSKILWEEAIEKDKLPWINVCDFEEGANRAFMMYNIQKLPTTFLIDRDSKMIDKFTSVSELEKAIKKAL